MESDEEEVVGVLIRFAPLSEFGGSLESVTDHQCGDLERLVVDGPVLVASGLGNGVEVRISGTSRSISAKVAGSPPSTESSTSSSTKASSPLSEKNVGD